MFNDGERFHRPLCPSGFSSPKNRLGVTLLAVLTLVASACSLPTKVRSMFGGELPFNVTLASDANENSAVAVDAVVVYDKNVLEQLMKVPAAEWFKKKDQFVNDHRGNITVQQWEWTPSQLVPQQTVIYRAGAQKVLLYADYASDGDHRAVVDPQQRFVLVLNKLNLDIKEIK